MNKALCAGVAACAMIAGTSVRFQASGDFSFANDSFDSAGALGGLAVGDSFSVDLTVDSFVPVEPEEARGGGPGTTRFFEADNLDTGTLVFLLAGAGAGLTFESSDIGLRVLLEIQDDTDTGSGPRDEILVTLAFQAPGGTSERGATEYSLTMFARFDSDAWTGTDPFRTFDTSSARFDGANIVDNSGGFASVFALDGFTAVPTPGVLALGACSLVFTRRRRV